MRVGLPSHPSLEPYSESIHMGSPGANQQVSIALQKIIYGLEHLTTPIVGKIPWPHDPPPLHEEGHKGLKLQPERSSDPHLISDARDLVSALQSVPAMPSPRNLRLLVFSDFCPQLLAHKPSSLAIPELQCSPLPAVQKKKHCPLGLTRSPKGGSNFSPRDCTPILQDALGTHAHSVTA